MSESVTVVWIDDGTQDVGSRAAAAYALDEWAKAHGVALALPQPTVTTGTPVDLEIGERVEQELGRAREAIAATDGDGVDQALARAEALLRGHPELPEGAWLRAEVERSWASRWLRLAPRDEARARTAWEHAAALDDGRVPGIGELTSTARPKSHVDIVVHGARAPARLVLRIDGVARTVKAATTQTLTYEVDLAPAEHQVVVTSDGRVVHASWAATTDAPMAIAVDDAAACSVEDLGAARRDDRRIDATGVTCTRWMVAVPTAAYGRLLVARCSGEQCEPLVEWHVDHGAVRPPAKVTAERKRWPAWATWTLVGFGAAGAAVVGIVASGVLQSRGTVQRFTVGGVRQE